MCPLDLFEFASSKVSNKALTCHAIQLKFGLVHTKNTQYTLNDVMQSMQSNIQKQDIQKIQYKQYMNIYNNKSTCRPPLVAEGDAHLHRFCLLAAPAVRETDIDPNSTQTRIYQSLCVLQEYAE